MLKLVTNVGTFAVQTIVDLFKNLGIGSDSDSDSDVWLRLCSLAKHQQVCTIMQPFL